MSHAVAGLLNNWKKEVKSRIQREKKEGEKLRERGKGGGKKFTQQQPILAHAHALM